MMACYNRPVKRLALAAAIVTIALLGFWMARREPVEEAPEGLDPAEEERDRLRRESARLMPGPLAGLSLGMSRAALEEARPGLEPRDGEGLVLEEELSSGAVVVYALDEASQAQPLERVQVMSRLPSSEALQPHLQSMVTRYGDLSGLFQCPNTGGVPTLRFVWRRERTAVADIFLFYGDRISVTLDLTSDENMRRSLLRSSCRPTSLAELADAFPMASLDDVRSAAE